MAKQSNRPVTFTTGVGVLEPYAYLTKPDYGNEAKGFGNPRGVYKASLTLPNDAKTQKLIDDIVAIHEAAYGEAKEAYEANPPQVARGKKPLLPYEGDLPFFDNGDGTTTFKFSGYASYTDKKTNENVAIVLRLYDSRGVEIKDVPAFIAGGSELKFKFKALPYKWNQAVGASVKLQLESVMVVSLAQGQGGDGGWGDEVEEGGYQADSQRPSNGGWQNDQDDEPQGDPNDSDDGDF